MILKILALIGFLLIMVYSIYIIIKNKKIPESISASVYVTKYKWTFSIIMWLLGILLMPYMLENLPENYKFLGFLLCGGIIGIGTDPLIKN